MSYALPRLFGADCGYSFLSGSVAVAFRLIVKLTFQIKRLVRNDASDAASAFLALIAWRLCRCRLPANR